MAIMLPPTLQTVSDMSRVWFPNVNEDIIHAHGDAARAVNAHSDTAAGGADTAVRGTSGSYRGEGATQLQSYWQETGNETGHMAQISTAARIAPVALDGIGYVASGTKVAVGTVLAAGAVRLAYASLLGPGAGASTIQTLLATRNAGMKIVRELSEGIEKRLGPGMMQRIKGPLDRAAERLRPPGAPGSPALAGAGHAYIPTPRAASASEGNGIARMARGNRRGGGDSGGRRGGRSSRGSSNDYNVTNDGRIHGNDLPTNAANMSEDEAKKALADLQQSIRTRQAEEERLGYEAGHEERIRREKAAAEQLEQSIKRNYG